MAEDGVCGIINNFLALKQKSVFCELTALCWDTLELPENKSKNKF